MTFPSALPRLEAGDTPEEALLYAMRHDTPLGFRAVTAVADAQKEGAADPVAFVRERVGPEHAHTVLRFERFGGALKVDFDPGSKLGAEVARLLGTDAARPLVERHTGMYFGFANCCAPVTAPEKKDTEFTIEQQIRWQASIDC